MPEICLKLTVKTPERRRSCRSGVLLLTLDIFHTDVILVLLLLTLNVFHTFF